MAKVSWFEITADDPDRAEKFYIEAFDWSFKPTPIPNMDYRLANAGTDEPGIDGAIMPRAYNTQPTIVTINVSDLDSTIEKVKAAGGEAIGQKQTIPGQGDFMYVRDTEGNTLGLMQPE